VIGFIFVEESREAVMAGDRRIRLPLDPPLGSDL
jgi:hypothetical protein